MASQAKRNRQLESVRTVRRTRVAVFIALVLTLGFMIGAWTYFHPNLGPIELRVQSQKKFDEEISLVLRDSPEARRLPVIARQKIATFVRLNHEQKVAVVADVQPTNDMYTLMFCACDRQIVQDMKLGKPGIVILPWMVKFTEKQTGPEALTSFAITLYHELVHLERWPLPSNPSEEVRITEEIRAYSRTNLEVVRPMIQSGFWVPKDFLHIDAIMRSCADNLKCAPFVEFMRTYSPTPKPVSTARSDGLFPYLKF